MTDYKIEGLTREAQSRIILKLERDCNALRRETNKLRQALEWVTSINSIDIEIDKGKLVFIFPNGMRIYPANDLIEVPVEQ